MYKIIQKTGVCKKQDFLLNIFKIKYTNIACFIDFNYKINDIKQFNK